MVSLILDTYPACTGLINSFELMSEDFNFNYFFGDERIKTKYVVVRVRRTTTKYDLGYINILKSFDDLKNGLSHVNSYYQRGFGVNLHFYYGDFGLGIADIKKFFEMTKNCYKAPIGKKSLLPAYMRQSFRNTNGFILTKRKDTRLF